MQLRDREPAAHARGPGFNPQLWKKEEGKKEREGERMGGKGKAGKEKKQKGKHTSRKSSFKR